MGCDKHRWPYAREPYRVQNHNILDIFRIVLWPPEMSGGVKRCIENVSEFPLRKYLVT